MKSSSLAWLVVAILAIAVYCWINRYEMSPISDTADSSPESVRLDRWTGEMCMVGFYSMLEKDPEAAICWP